MSTSDDELHHAAHDDPERTPPDLEPHGDREPFGDQRDEDREAFHRDVAWALAKLTNPGRGSRATVQTKTGGSYSYEYAGLDAILAHVRDPLAEFDLAVCQPVTVVDDAVTVHSYLLHRTGHRLDGGTIRRNVQGGPQELGSFVTYARRYALCAMLGIHPEGEDDDAAAAQPAQRKAAEPGLPDPIVGGFRLSERTADELRELVAAPPSQRLAAMAQAHLDLRTREGAGDPSAVRIEEGTGDLPTEDEGD